MFKIIQAKKEKKIFIGIQYSETYNYALKGKYWKDAPKESSVFTPSR